MSRKIRLTGLGLVVIIIIAGLIAIAGVSSSNIGAVKGLTVQKVSSNAVDLKWKRVGSADGYYLYKKTDNGSKKIKTIKDPSETTYKLNKLDDATSYELYAVAYKQKGKKTVVSKEFTTVSTVTKPLKQICDAVASGEGSLRINWQVNPKVSGYVVQYSKSEDFAESEKIVVKDINSVETELADLKVGDKYFIRARSYMANGEDNLYGAWSKAVNVEVMSKADMSKVDPTKPMIAVTFDDGPGYNSASDRILDVLEKYNIRATFFMLGKNAANNTANVKRKVELGCEIGNHTYNHEHYGKNVTASDIKKASDAIYEACGQYPTAFRSPGGNTTSKIRNECKSENMPLYYWSLDTQDWKSRDADKVYNAVIKHVEDGDIILMHEIYESTADAFERMVPKLIKEGYQFVTCEELVEAKSGKKPTAGTQYVNGTTIRNKTY